MLQECSCDLVVKGTCCVRAMSPVQFSLPTKAATINSYFHCQLIYNFLVQPFNSKKCQIIVKYIYKNLIAQTVSYILDIQLNREKQEILKFKILEPESFWRFCFRLTIDRLLFSID